MLLNDYYRNSLSHTAKGVYDQILNQIGKLAAEGSVEINLPPITKDEFIESHLSGGRKDRVKEVTNAYYALKNDRPEFFFLNNQIRIESWMSGKIVLSYESRFNHTQIQRINRLIKRTVRKMVEDSQDRNVIETERKIYDLIAESYTYEKGDYRHDLSGLLIYKTGVCEALSALLIVALRSAGIPARKVQGYSLLNGVRKDRHCWVLAQINGKPCHLDVTWDLAKEKKKARHKYFNLSEKEITKDHEILSGITTFTSTEVA